MNKLLKLKGHEKILKILFFDIKFEKYWSLFTIAITEDVKLDKGNNIGQTEVSLLRVLVRLSEHEYP